MMKKSVFLCASVVKIQSKSNRPICTAGADARDGDIAQIGMEMGRRGNMFQQRLEQVQLYADDLAADPADQVQVRDAVVAQLKQALPVADIDQRDQAERIEQVEGPVDGGELDIGVERGYAGVDLIGGRCPVELMQYQQNLLALGGQAKTALVELIEENLFTRHGPSCLLRIFATTILAH